MKNTTKNILIGAAIVCFILFGILAAFQDYEIVIENDKIQTMVDSKMPLRSHKQGFDITVTDAKVAAHGDSLLISMNVDGKNGNREFSGTIMGNVELAYRQGGIFVNNIDIGQG